jgi:hypothetical protein
MEIKPLTILEKREFKIKMLVILGIENKAMGMLGKLSTI